MKRQGVDALLPLHCVNTDHRRFARELDRRDNRIELGHIKIAIELLARLPIFDEQQGLAFVEIRIETGIEAARRNPCWSKHRAESAQQRCSLFIGGYDLHREDDQDSCLSVAVRKEQSMFPVSHRKKRAKAEGARIEREMSDGSVG
jgi:hypothetical protein